jgi:hypothetical protein
LTTPPTPSDGSARNDAARARRLTPVTDDPREEAAALPELRETPHDPPSRRTHRAEDARAYARLLVSDIRLYHDMDVVLGRAASDLAARLEEPLREARARFLARYEDDAAFDREVVSVLAGGDPRRLGR